MRFITDVKRVAIFQVFICVDRKPVPIAIAPVRYNYDVITENGRELILAT